MTSATRRMRCTTIHWLLPALAGIAVGLAVPRVLNAAPSHLPLNRGPAPWPLPDRVAERIRVADLPPYAESKPLEHPHAHLDVFADGAHVPVPAGLGLAPPYSSLHTHCSSGILHMEARRSDSRFTLGDLFALWGVRLSRSCVGSYCEPESPARLYVNGPLQSGPISGVVLEPL